MPNQSSNWGPIFIHHEWNAAAVTVFSSNHAADWAEGAYIGLRDTNIYKVDYKGHGRVHVGDVSPAVVMTLNNIIETADYISTKSVVSYFRLGVVQSFINQVVPTA